MRNFFFGLGAFLIFNSYYAQEVIASGQEPAWILDWDGGKNFTFYQGENTYNYTLASNPTPKGSSKEISEAWNLKGEKGKIATLVIDFFDPMSAESCPCFHDFGEGLNNGKAYFITENGQFYIRCAEITEQPITFENQKQ